MLKKIIINISLLLISPEKGWLKMRKDSYKHEEFMSNFLFPLFGLASLTAFIGGLWIDGGGLQYALKLAIFVMSGLFGGFYLSSLLIAEMMPKYGAIKDKNMAQQFVGYSSIIVYLLFLVMPFLGGLKWIWLLSLASFYVIYPGSRHFLDIYGIKGYRFSTIALLSIVLLPILINYLLKLMVI